jgi:aminopeptidase YwaD
MQPVQRAAGYLNKLCIEIPTRAVGSAGNRAATDWFAQTIAAYGFETETHSFDCMDWSSSGAALTVAGVVFPAHAGPYALGCDVRAPLVVVTTIAELETAPLGGQIVLLRGELASEPLMPKNFTFYNPEDHQRIYRVLESQQPTAIIAATGMNPSMAGAMYPFPMFEDGDFDIPSVYLTDVEGARIAQHAGDVVHLVSRTERLPATACNIRARRQGYGYGRIVIMAHIDAKAGTPGALDNAAGVSTLLLLAELLEDYAGRHTIEIVAVNGEDYYANPGEMDYLRRNEGQFDAITLGINLDGLGYCDGRTAYSLYGCSLDMADALRAGFAAFPGFCEGETWYQGDHMMMVSHGRPALALTSECAMELLAKVIHTEHDTPALIDTARLAEAALALRNVIGRVDMLSA